MCPNVVGRIGTSFWVVISADKNCGLEPDSNMDLLNVEMPFSGSEVSLAMAMNKKTLYVRISLITGGS
jgi:hypothetical protein